MGRPSVPIALGFLKQSDSAQAAVYSRVSRKIGKEPAYELQPHYALLLFGDDCALSVWIVLDGHLIYIDRNADGDLTDRGERFTAGDCGDIELIAPDEETRYLIRRITVIRNEERAWQFLDVDVAIEGPVSFRQYCNVDLAPSTCKARIAHFNGPLTIGPRMVNWKVSQSLSLVTGGTPTVISALTGTMNAEYGCWVAVRTHAGDIPAFGRDTFPVVDVQFLSAVAGDAPVCKRYPLDKVC